MGNTLNDTIATSTRTTKRRSYVRFIVVAIAVLIVGLALGAGRSADDASVVNTASKVLLAVGFLGLVATAALEVIGRVRHRS